MESELEASDDTGIAACASERPEKVGVLSVTGAHEVACRSHDLRGLEIVDCYAELSG